jgi:hypothetical protein
MRVIRSIYLGLTLSIGTIFAHHLAGGDFVQLRQFFMVALATYGAGALLSASEMEGPGLASAIVITQLLGHFALSANYQNSLTMYTAHISIGLLSYLILGYIESFARWAFDALFVSFKALPKIEIKKTVISLFQHQTLIFLRRAIIRFWSPAPPLNSF